MRVIHASIVRHIYIILIVFLTACGSTPHDKTNTDKVDSSSNLQTTISVENNPLENIVDNNYATYFVVIADTSTDYALLHKKMVHLNKKLHIPIDTMGRFYNEAKNLIALPDNDEDEIYAGDYFPRRFPSNNLSLEYVGFYQGQVGKKTIALVTGIYETERVADSALAVLHQIEKKVFKIKADIYVGCMH